MRGEKKQENRWMMRWQEENKLSKEALPAASEESVGGVCPRCHNKNFLSIPKSEK